MQDRKKTLKVQGCQDQLEMSADKSVKRFATRKVPSYSWLVVAFVQINFENLIC